MRRLLIGYLQHLATFSATVAVLLLSLVLLLHGESWAARALGLPHGQERLWHAVGTGDWTQIRRALAEGARIDAPNAAGNTPLVVAAASEHPQVVRELLQRNADPDRCNDLGVTPLVSAIFAGRVQTVELLLKAGASPEARAPDQRSPLIAAVCAGKRDIVELLIAAGADVNATHARGGTALRTAIEYEHPDLAAMLRYHGAVAGRPDAYNMRQL